MESVNSMVSGLRYLPDFLQTQKDRDDLLDFIDQGDRKLEQEIFSRRTLRFGYHFDYFHGGGLKKIEDIPLQLLPIVEKVQNLDEFTSGQHQISQIIVNEYTGLDCYITKHIDSLDFGPAVGVLSLGDPCLIVLHERTPKDPTSTNEIVPYQDLQSTGKKVNLILQPGSLLILSGEARYRWQHEIPKLSLWKKFLGDSWKTLAFGNEDFILENFRRVSITMRSVVVDVE